MQALKKTCLLQEDNEKRFMTAELTGGSWRNNEREKNCSLIFKNRFHVNQLA